MTDRVASSAAPNGDQIADIEVQPLHTNQQEMELQAFVSTMVGKFFKFDSNGKLLSISEVLTEDPSTNLMSLSKGRDETKSDPREIEMEKVACLIPESTNAWLYLPGSPMVNIFIAIFVICIQITSYISLTYFLASQRTDEISTRKESCYGENCDAFVPACLSFGTGGALTSVLLVGFLWADVVNTVSLMRHKCVWLTSSLIVLAELATAIVCGFLVAVYSESDFDAIGAAIGILFVHELDEKVFASMKVFDENVFDVRFATVKKIQALLLWVVTSLVIALAVGCRYEDGAFFGQCLESEYTCDSGECIWEGFVCNGVSDCSDESDEYDACNYTNTITCPGSDARTHEYVCAYYGYDRLANECHNIEPTYFMCESSGACIPYENRCNGVSDCDDGSDEGQAAFCPQTQLHIRCGNLNATLESDGYTQVWTGQFKCNNGQCIDAQYACDGVPNDCVDGSDEYPNFDKSRSTPWMVSCPYASMISCNTDEVLCKISGRCITKESVCNGIDDCADGGDENNCEFSCEKDVKNATSFQCGGNIAFINDTHIIPWFNSSAYNVSDLTIANDGDTDWDTLLSYSTGKCIPMQWRCDGTVDCEDGSDEKLCSLYSCGDDEYQCTNNGKCVPKTWLCDGTDDCGNAEDEMKQICQQNDIDPTAVDRCVDNGYHYTCDGCNTCCLYDYQLCDLEYDCPNGEDERDCTHA
eukprot:181574_1